MWTWETQDKRGYTKFYMFPILIYKPSQATSGLMDSQPPYSKHGGALLGLCPAEHSVLSVLQPWPSHGE